ncbi:MAG: V-type ATPase subunit [Thermoplasmata archaeon]|nr:V-type ATPase subunit [Thermoplasmata archaeon]
MYRKISGDTNFPYLCTRVKVKSLKLYSQQEIQRMIDMDVREILRFLHEGVYREEVEEGSIKYRFSTSDVIEYALNRNLGRAYTEIYRYASGGAKARMEIFLENLDIWNLKTFLRGIHSQTPKDEVLMHILSGGKYPEAFWEKAMSTDDPEQYFEKTEFGKVMKEYLAEKNLARVEDRIERDYYVRLVNYVKLHQDTRADTVFLEFVRKEIDIRNLGTAMKIMFYRQGTEDVCIASEEIFIPGGWSINHQKFRELCESKDNDEFLSQAAGLWFGNEITEIIRECGHCSGQIKRLEHYLARIAKNFAVIYPISILPVISYLLRKKIEVEQIRIIARGKAHGLPRSEITGMLGW